MFPFHPTIKIVGTFSAVYRNLNTTAGYVDGMLFVFSNMYVGALESDKSENSAENDENAEQLKIAKIVQSLINCSILCCKDHVER